MVREGLPRHPCRGAAKAQPMRSEATIRDAHPADEAAWRALWAAYCAFYETSIAEDVTRTTWARILDSAQPVHALVAVGADGHVVGFSNYVLHPYTWGSRPACYLEDLFVAPGARRQGVGAALIGELVARGERHGWGRIYWHTREGNATARRVYDRLATADDFVRYVRRIAEADRA
jgi:GNAT superfamily N-acetyltransferase